jgi:hypothetical protein
MVTRFQALRRARARGGAIDRPHRRRDARHKIVVETEMLYYNSSPRFRRMAHHHHNPGDAHPEGRISPSLLRMSVIERIAIAAVAVLVLWAAVWWALSQS